MQKTAIKNHSMMNCWTVQSFLGTLRNQRLLLRKRQISHLSKPGIFLRSITTLTEIFRRLMLQNMHLT